MHMHRTNLTPGKYRDSWPVSLCLYLIGSMPCLFVCSALLSTFPCCCLAPKAETLNPGFLGFCTPGSSKSRLLWQYLRVPVSIARERRRQLNQFGSRNNGSQVARERRWSCLQGRPKGSSLVWCTSGWSKDPCRKCWCQQICTGQHLCCAISNVAHAYCCSFAWMHDSFSCFRHCDRIKHACRISSISSYQAEPLSFMPLVSIHAMRSITRCSCSLLLLSTAPCREKVKTHPCTSVVSEFIVRATAFLK